jgi:hypothetical protein
MRVKLSWSANGAPMVPGIFILGLRRMAEGAAHQGIQYRNPGLSLRLPQSAAIQSLNSFFSLTSAAFSFILFPY